MSHLTIEKMDKINFLITEVSLECLGNKFFDIYGNQANSLLRLISVSSLQPQPTDADAQSELWKSLTVEKRRSKINRIKVPTVEPVKIGIKRRASFSMANNETDTSNDPESLLVPMAPKPAKIMNRRSTISVQSAKHRKTSFPSPIKAKPVPIPKPTSTMVKLDTKLIADIQKNLKKDTESRYNAMRLLSESQEDKYRTLNINPNMDDFYKAEEKSLFTQCNTLVKFIKFIQEDRDNALKLANISKAILELQKDY